MMRSHSRHIAVGIGIGALALAAGGRPVEAQVMDTFIAVDEQAAAPAVAAKRAAAGAMFVGPMGPGMELGGKTVTGAPYSADAITETTQTLADGNRIVRKQSASVARDSQGRTRREMSVTAIGSFVPEDAPKWVMIYDPIAGYFYTLDEQRQTAMRRPLPKDGEMSVAIAGSGEGGTVAYSARAEAAGSASEQGTRMQSETGRTVITGGVNTAGVPAGAPGGPPPAIGSVTLAMPALAAKNANHDVKTEPLGTQAIEGVEAVGTRTTITIPAGEIGNEQPIRIVSEEWYSKDLQTTVLSKREDPRMGETIYRLTNVSRNEPAATLFEVPAGYTVTDPEFMPGMKRRSPNRP